MAARRTGLLLGVVFVATLLVGLLAPSLEALGAEGAPALERPKYQTLRFDEDWSVLADGPVAGAVDFFDRIKYIPLTGDGWAWASFGGQIRERFEVWNDFGFGAPADRNDSFLLTRIFLHTDLHLGPHVRLFLEGKSAHSTDRDLPGGRRTLDTDDLDLQNAFIDLMLYPSETSKLTLRAGRQELLFGRQRLVSPLDWSNTRRTWEGVSLIAEFLQCKTTAFWTRFVPVEQHSFNDETSADFYGVYATGKTPVPGMSLDLYWLGLNRDGAAFNGTSGRERRQTLGGRIFGDIGETGIDYDLEYAAQFGEVGDEDIRAFMVGSQVGYKVRGVAGSPRVYVGFDYGSGDDHAGGDVQTFNQLFPLGHAFLGYIDIIGRQNIMDLNYGVSCKPVKKLTVKLDGHHFRRADSDDGLYNAGGGLVRPGSAGSDREVGTEIDLTVKYQVDRHLAAICGYSHFFAGDFIAESGSNDDIDFGYLTLQYTF